MHIKILSVIDLGDKYSYENRANELFLARRMLFLSTNGHSWYNFMLMTTEI